MADAQLLDRRHAAVLAMDVAGYSRLMSLDEEGTYRRVREKMHGMVEPAIAALGGRIVKGTGDGALIEFSDPVSAVRFATELQQQNEAAEQAHEVERRIRFRVGISLGDVIVEDGDIFGDGVNIAARLEGIADVGGICVSEAVATSGEGSGFVFLNLGLKPLKNITRPIRVYQVALSGEAGATDHVAGASLVKGFGERPAIAVLPFRSYGMGPEVEYLADGITEDVISALARWRSFPVISRNSVFAFKGKDLDAKFAGQQLGARYINEGTLRRHGSHMRATVLLTDVETMENLLAEQYDYDRGDVFAMQDEIVRTILGAIEPELLRHERERIARTPQQNPTAYDLFQRGQWHHYHYTQSDNMQARALLRDALAIDPDYAQATAMLSIAVGVAAHWRWVDDPRAAHAETLTLARHAVSADPRDPLVHFALGLACYHTSRIQEAMEALRQAIRLNPSYAAAHANLAFAYNYLNRPEEALASVQLALRLSPHDPRRALWLPAEAGSYYLSGRYKEALAVGQEALSTNSNLLTVVRYLVGSLGQLGRAADAKMLLPVLRRLDGDIAGTEAHLRLYFVDAAANHILDGLRKAGFQ